MIFLTAKNFTINKVFILYNLVGDKTALNLSFTFSEAFINLRKVTISFVMSVCPTLSPYVHVEQLEFQWRNCH